MSWIVKQDILACYSTLPLTFCVSCDLRPSRLATRAFQQTIISLLIQTQAAHIPSTLTCSLQWKWVLQWVKWLGRGIDGWGILVRFAVGTLDSSPFRNFQAQHPIKRIPGPFRGAERSGNEVNHSPLSNVEVKNEWSPNSTLPIFPHGALRAKCIVIIFGTIHELTHMQFSFFSYFFLLLISKYFPHRHVAKHPQPIFFS
jgi:hypothetical protein